jgi:predicted metalloprotease with PDZ domain
MLNAVDDGYGGLEHRNSTALIASRRDLPRLGETRTSEGYTTLLGLISHEYFHTWNVKRLRPADFAHYDYTRENYTRCCGSLKALPATTTTCCCAAAACWTTRPT